MKKASLAIQCTAPDGTVGTFLYSSKNESGYVLASPVMSGCAELIVWCKENNWKSCEGPSPVGNYVKYH